MTIPEAKRITRMNEWKQLIHERQQSGQSVRAWCLQNGIHENSYYYWLRIIREAALCEAEKKSGALVRVEPEKLAVETVSPQSSSGGIVIRVNIPSEMVLSDRADGACRPQKWCSAAVCMVHSYGFR